MTASAADTGSIVITSKTEETHGRLVAYQIFAANSTSVNDTIEVTGWGTGINVNNFISALKSNDTLKTKFGDTVTAESNGAVNCASVVSGLSSAEMAVFADIVVDNLASAYASQTYQPAGQLISGLGTGYYVVVDADAATKGDYTAYTNAIIRVVDGVETGIEAKIDFPEFDKQIGDVNDSVTNDVTYGEDADHDIGDAVPFKLIATVPSNLADYDTYKMIFHDNIDESVFDIDIDSITVKVEGENGTFTTLTNTDDYTLTTTDLSLKEGKLNDNTKVNATEDFTVSIADIKVKGAVAGKTVVVEYNATLKDTANLGAKGNWNGAYLEYSNNPNMSAEGDTDNTGDSPDDYVVAFTYETLINKVDNNNQALEGAEFTLYKQYAEIQTNKGEAYSEATEGEYWYPITAVKNKESGDQFMFKGLDDGNYLLVETTAPDSYKAITPFKFTINATHADEALTALTAEAESAPVGTSFTTGKVYNLANEAYTLNSESANYASLTATIANSKLNTLPSTGGMGTKLFYLGGGAMVAVAGVFLIAKKRAGKTEN